MLNACSSGPENLTCWKVHTRGVGHGRSPDHAGHARGPTSPQAHHRSRCIACDFSGSFGGNIVGRIWVCLLCGTSSHAANHCPSFVITCRTRGWDSRLPAPPNNRKSQSGQFSFLSKARTVCKDKNATTFYSMKQDNRSRKQHFHFPCGFFFFFFKTSLRLFLV